MENTGNQCGNQTLNCGGPLLVAGRRGMNVDSSHTHTTKKHDSMDEATGKRQRDRRKAKPLVAYPDYTDHSASRSDWIAHLRGEKEDDEAKRSQGGPRERFPVKLLEMLRVVEQSEHSAVVRFQPHGRAFKVYDRTLFVKEVLPRYFKHQSDYASFLRQLNQYGFLRMTARGANSPDEGAYYHELFLRGRPDLCELIPRLKECSRHTKRSVYDVSTEPNFYSMVSLPPFGSSVAEPCSDQQRDNSSSAAAATHDSLVQMTMQHVDLISCGLYIGGPESSLATPFVHDNLLSGANSSCANSMHHPLRVFSTDAGTSVAQREYTIAASQTSPDAEVNYRATTTSFPSFSLLGYVQPKSIPRELSTLSHCLTSAASQPPRSTSNVESTHCSIPQDSRNQQCESPNYTDDKRGFDVPLHQRHQGPSPACELTESIQAHNVSCDFSPSTRSVTKSTTRRKKMKRLAQLDPSLEAKILQMEPESIAETLEHDDGNGLELIEAAAMDLTSSSENDTWQDVSDTDSDTKEQT